MLQGLTLPSLIREPGLAGTPGSRREEEEARRIALEAALEHLNEAPKKGEPEFAGVYYNLEQRYRAWKRWKKGTRRRKTEAMRTAAPFTNTTRAFAISHASCWRFSANLLSYYGMKDGFNDEVLRELEHELDLSELRLHTKSHD